MELLTIKDAAKRLGVHPSTVARLLNSEQLGGQKIGSTWVVEQDDLVNYLKNRTVRQRSRKFPGSGRRNTDPNTH